ncbi:MAG: CHAP domain-containing protein [Dysgonamonadaceae bacterium]|jgi:hypothetical protein|nr:CHAP domain-containing protein [Dysgonamonadaceae bacterium]
MKKQVLTLLLSLCFALGFALPTQQQVINDLNGRVGQCIDWDGYYGCQCVDLTMFVCNTYWGFSPNGNAVDYRSMNLPSGWQRIQYSSGFVPEPGDIFIGLGGPFNATYGHIGVVESASGANMWTFEQNGGANSSLSNGSPLAKHTRSYSGVWGIIRPPYQYNTPPPPELHDGDGSSNNPYKIWNLTDLESVRYHYADKNKYFKLMADIDMLGIDNWDPIGGFDKVFNGVFDGNGKTVFGLRHTNFVGGDPGHDDNKGLFGSLNGATVKNLFVRTSGFGIDDGQGGTKGGSCGILAGQATNSTIQSCHVYGQVHVYCNAGALVGTARGCTIEDCSAEDVDIKSLMWNTGGLVGNLADAPSTIRRCVVRRATLASVNHDAIGGLVGTVETSSPSTIQDCEVYQAAMDNETNGHYGAGGLIGCLRQANISDCRVLELTLPDNDMGDMGGFIGRIDNTDDHVLVNTITNCYVSNVTANNMGGNCGGFIGIVSDNTTISNCSVKDAVLQARGTAGGFIGWRRATAGTINNCQAYATITTIDGRSWAEYVGGFIGANDGGGNISNCLFVGTVNVGLLQDVWTTPQAGGFIGSSKADSDITNCAAIASVSSSHDNFSGYAEGNTEAGIGGFLGTMNNGNTTKFGKISNSYFSGKVQGKGKVGGFVGTIRNGGGWINYCYAHAAVTAASNEKVGGFIGYHYNGAPAIWNSYFIGSISAPAGGTTGSFCGVNEGGAQDGWAQTIDGRNGVGSGSSAVISISSDNLKTLASYTGISGYVNQDGQTYPYLSAQSAPAKWLQMTQQSASGSLFNSAPKVELLRNFASIGNAQLNGLNWSFNYSPALANGSTAEAIVYENGKMVAYPTTGTVGLFTGIETVAPVAKASVYLNQVSNVLSIRVQELDHIRNVVVSNLTGSIVWNKSYDNSSVDIPFNRLSTGVYIVQVTTSEGTKTHKIIKQ